MTSTACVQCTQVNVGLLIGVLFAMWFCVVVLHVLSQTASDESKVGLFFLSSLRFIVGPASTWLSWLGLFEQNRPSIMGRLPHAAFANSTDRGAHAGAVNRTGS